MEKKDGDKTIFNLQYINENIRRNLVTDLMLFGCCVYKEDGDKISYIPIEEWPNECFKNPQRR